MEMLSNIAVVLFFGVIVFLWNKFVVEFIVHLVLKKNPNNRWLLRNKEVILSFSKSFYWFGFFIIAVGILFFEG
jgi:hypothetical protein